MREDEAAVVPAEAAVKELIERLVGPLLALRYENSLFRPPSESQQETVAKQMHAVVILYNYYQLKHFKHLEFLGFGSFCKIVSKAHPRMPLYMKFFANCQVKDSVNPDVASQLSITEKKIMEACVLCSALDPSKDAPDMKAWVTAKVSVFLSDPAKKKCLLQFSSITKGVWSLVERDLDKPVQMDTSRKALYGLHLQAISLVEEKTGIKSSNLKTHLCRSAYSLSKEKTVACLFMMTYSNTGYREEFTEVPIEDVMTSLRGPVVKNKIAPETTSVVEFFHLLPYVHILSDWLSLETTDDSFDFLNHDIHVDDYLVYPEQVHKDDINNASRKSDEKVDKQIHNTSKTAGQTAKTKGDYIYLGDSPEATRTSKNNGYSPGRIGKSSDKDDQSSHVKVGLGQKTCQGMSNRETNVTHKVEPSDDFKANAFASPSNKSLQVNKFANNICKEGDSIHAKRPLDLANYSKQPATSIQDRTAIIPVNVEYCPTHTKYDTYHLAANSRTNSLLEASLQVLQKKRDNLCNRNRLLEDEIARCEMNIQFVLNEIGGARTTLDVEQILDLCQSFCGQLDGDRSFSSEQTTFQSLKRRRLSEALFILRSATQELDDICSTNNWLSPRYIVFPSLIEGKFIAHVTIQGIDFDCTTSGESTNSASEARDSAAMCMITKLRNMAGRAQ